MTHRNADFYVCHGVSVGLQPIACRSRPEGMTLVMPVARSSGLTLAGCVTPAVCVRGVTRERRDHKLL